jgi:hypothetical protein
MLAPGEEPANGMQVGRAGVPVADGGGEEFQEAAGGVLAGVGDDRRRSGLAAGTTVSGRSGFDSFSGMELG